MRSGTASRMAVLLALALVLVAASMAPAGAKRGRVWETHTCAEEFGTSYVWDTDSDDPAFELALTPDVPTACVDLLTAGGDFTVSFTNNDARVVTYYASVRDSVPGNHCVDDPGWNSTGDDLMLTGVPASGLEACGESPNYPDTDPALALWIGGDFKGRPVGSLDVTITYEG